jgi:hypothetical protein
MFFVSLYYIFICLYYSYQPLHIMAAMISEAAGGAAASAPTAPIGDIVLVNPSILDHLPDLACTICQEVLRGTAFHALY